MYRFFMEVVLFSSAFACVTYILNKLIGVFVTRILKRDYKPSVKNKINIFLISVLLLLLIPYHRYQETDYINNNMILNGKYEDTFATLIYVDSLHKVNTVNADIIVKSDLDTDIRLCKDSKVYMNKLGMYFTKSNYKLLIRSYDTINMD